MGLTDLAGDPESKRGGVTGRIILESTFKKILPQILDGHPDLTFMQDRAEVHKRRELVAWLKEKGYNMCQSLVRLMIVTRVLYCLALVLEDTLRKRNTTR